MLNPGFWILDFVDLGFGISIPSTSKCLEALVLSMFRKKRADLQKTYNYSRKCIQIGVRQE